MTDIKRQLHMHIWESDFGVVGRMLTMYEANQMLKKYHDQYRCWILSGQTAVVRVVTEDENITRLQAIQYARSIVSGQSVTLSFDLDRCEVTWERIFNSSTPGH